MRIFGGPPRLLATACALLVWPGCAQIAPLNITSTSPLPAATQGASYSFTFAAVGGQTPYSWFGGTFPPGLTLSSAGVLSGTPTQAGGQPFSFTVAVTDAARSTVRQTFQMTVNPPPAVTTTSLPDVTQGVSYNQALAASGGTKPYTWKLAAGSLPPGLTLSSGGVISGQPASFGPFDFTVQVNDAANAFAQGRLRLLVRVGVSITTSGPFPVLTTGIAAAPITFAAAGGVIPYSWSVAQGQLPPGMQLSAGGVLSGTPTQDGAFDFVIRAADSSGAAATKAFSIQVGLGLSITTPQALPGIPVGTPYNVKLDAINGTPPYTWDVPPPDQLPPGLTLDAAKGILSGTPLSAGQYNFPIRVTDAAKAAYTKIFSLAVGATSAALQVNPIGLVFNAFNGGDSPAPKFLSVTSTTGFPIPFTARVDGCSPGSATPKWLEVRPVKGSTPARLRVAVDSTGLTGRLEACITLTGNRQDTSVRVQLNVNEQGPKLEVQPESLRFSGSPAALAESIQAILIRNAGGGGSRPFRAFAKRASTWLALSPTTGQTAPNAPSLVRVSVIPGTLRRGVYFDTIVVQSLAETLEVPVVLLIGAAGPVIGVSQNGVRFDARSLNGFANQKNVSVLNLGEGTLNWKAEVVSGSWLALQDPAGQTVRGRPARLGLVANPGTLPPGGQYGLVKISDPQAANSPQFVVAVLNLADSAKTAALPDPSPSGLFFVANQSNSQTQTIRLFTSSLTEVAFDASASTEDGGDWLSVDPAQGKTYTSNPAVLTVTVKTLNLPPDVYRGDITVHLGGAVVRTTNVTLIVPKLGASALSSKSETRGLAGCAPKSMVLTHTGLVNSFGAPTGWPTPLVVRVSDDCGDPVTNAQVVATFSNGDPALPLRMSDPQVGLYAGTWSASGASDAVTVTAVANSALLGRAAREIIGTVTAAQAPVLNRDSTYNAWNAERSGPIAPGTWVSIYGSNLAPGPVTPKDFPFPTLVNGTTVLVGGVEAPLFYVSPTQINALIPAELAPAQEYSILVAANGGYTLPETLVTTAVRPGVLAFFPNKPIIAQHADYSLITDASPAKPGENFTMYLLGMGDTDPKVATNAPAPSTPPFALVTTQPEVRINGAAAPVSYAGLTPGTVGLYQINTKVPDDAPDGQLTVTVTQGDATANEVVIPVKR